jgi:hypothetical protein
MCSRFEKKLLPVKLYDGLYKGFLFSLRAEIW